MLRRPACHTVSTNSIPTSYQTKAGHRFWLARDIWSDHGAMDSSPTLKEQFNKILHHIKWFLEVGAGVYLWLHRLIMHSIQNKDITNTCMVIGGVISFSVAKFLLENITNLSSICRKCGHFVKPKKDWNTMPCTIVPLYQRTFKIRFSLFWLRNTRNSTAFTLTHCSN